MKTHKTATIVVTFNRLVHLQQIIPLIRGQVNVDTDIIIVNNGSTDGTAEWLGLEENSDLIVFHQENTGGAGGFNRGIREAYQLGYAFFWLMDDDVYPKDDALCHLLNKASLLSNDFGFLCSYVEGNSGKPINVPILDMSVNKDTRYLSWLGDVNIGLRLTAATFVSVLFPRQIVESIGLPIKDFFIWSDDIEYTYRASRVANSYFVLESRVIHKRNIEKLPNLKDETNPGRVKMQFYSIRNGLYNIRKMNKGAIKLAKIANLCLKQFCYAVSASDLKKEKTKVVLKGVWDGVFFNPTIEKVSGNR